MNTPICDFVKKYAEGGTVRLHMPGHKGKGDCEAYDITEIKGADSLYDADGIIAESEANASALFGAKTFYSAEGSSLSIRAMLYLTLLYAKETGVERPVIAASRNAHKTFVHTSALLDLDIMWLCPDDGDGYLSSNISTEYLEKAFERQRPFALYLTSPDYLGNVLDISAISKLCKRLGIILLVDNAHGAYLKFLEPSRHPIDLGAAMCCDSAHKTLPVLTGGAYLHISNDAPALFAREAKNALALFGSTSPSYLILRSLDAANLILSGGYAKKIAERAEQVEKCRACIGAAGYDLSGSEPLKLTLRPKSRGYLGDELADILRSAGFECEFADPDHIVFMFSPETSKEEIESLQNALLSISSRDPILQKPPGVSLPERVLSPREALASPRETIAAEDAVGRVLAFASVGCPPAVPIVVCGERIDERAAELFLYYGIKTCAVIK